MTQPSQPIVHDPYEAVTNRMLELLKKGVVAWQKPWRGGCPHNLFTERPYGLLNALLLANAGFGSPGWATRRQIEEHGGRIRADQANKQCIVIYYRPRRRFWRNTEFGWLEGTGSLVLGYDVWNIEQTEALERYRPVPSQTVPVEAAQQLVDQMTLRPEIRANPERAFYHPVKDYISLPSKSEFSQLEEFYCTLFHELIHSTGRRNRLERRSLKEINTFGDHTYSEEELVAELGAAFLCGVARIERVTAQNSAGYIQYWWSALQKDFSIFLRAIAQTQRACEFIQGRIEVRPEDQIADGKQRELPASRRALAEGRAPYTPARPFQKLAYAETLDIEDVAQEVKP